MYGVDFTVCVPAGAVLLRAIWVKHSAPTPELDESGHIDAPVTAPPSASTANVAGAGDTIPDR